MNKGPPALMHSNTGILGRVLRGNPSGNFAALIKAVQEFEPIRFGILHTTAFPTSNGPVVAQLVSTEIPRQLEAVSTWAVAVNLIEEINCSAASALIKIRTEFATKISGAEHALAQYLGEVRRDWFHIVTATSPAWIPCPIEDMQLHNRAFRLAVRMAEKTARRELLLDDGLVQFKHGLRRYGINCYDSFEEDLSDVG